MSREEMKKFLKVLSRVVAVNILYAAYSAIICWRLICILNKFEDEYKNTDTMGASIFFTVMFIIFHAILSGYVIWKDFSDQDSGNAANNIMSRLKYSWKKLKINEQTWCHVPMFLFIAFSIVQYGMVTHYQFKAVNPKLNNTNVMWNTTCKADWGNRSAMLGTNGSDVDLKDCKCSDFRIIDDIDFYTLQAAMPLLVITYILYPYPDRYYKPGEMFAIAIEFLNAFDILDLLEDIGCVQNYGDGWIAVFYFALGVSTLLLAFPVGLEYDDEDDPVLLRIATSVLTLIFTDAMFTIIRILVMCKEKDSRTGFHFLVKNILALLLRPWLIYHGIKQRKKAKEKKKERKWEQNVILNSTATTSM